jgi:hypothetical protein
MSVAKLFEPLSLGRGPAMKNRKPSLRAIAVRRTASLRSAYGEAIQSRTKRAKE